MEHAGEPLFSWLHLSDIHFGHGNATTREEQKLVLAQLLRDVRKAMQQGAPRPDAVFITGDIGFSGDMLQRDEYTQATHWLGQLAERLQLAPHNIYLVPGNHDVARVRPEDTSSFQLISALRTQAANLDEMLNRQAERRMLAGRFENFLKFAAPFGPACDTATTSLDHLFWRRRVEAREGMAVRLVGLNTAILANDDQDHGVLRLGVKQLTLAFDGLSSQEFVIALGHHPLDWLKDGAYVDGWLQARVHLYLSGHVHEQGTVLIQRGGGKRFVHIVAGASHDTSGPGGLPGRFSFNFGALHGGQPSRIQVRLWPFVWTKFNEFRLDRDNLGGDPSQTFIDHELVRPQPTIITNDQFQTPPIPLPAPTPQPASIPSTAPAPEPVAPSRPPVAKPPLLSQTLPPQTASIPSTAPAPKPVAPSRPPVAKPPLLPAPKEEGTPIESSSRRRVWLVLGALGLIFSSVGVTQFVLSRPPPPPMRIETEAPKSILQSPELPTIEGTGTEALVKLRRRHQVRPLQDSEKVRIAAHLPSGVFGFAPSASLQRLDKAAIQHDAAPDAFEVHKTPNGTLHLVGFVSHGDSQLVTADKPVTLRLIPKDSQVQTYFLISIPFDRISKAKLSTSQPGAPVEISLNGTSP
jgi:predicted MPP superfamily phosphohydrolase